jgi:hypothetical protein
MGVDWIDGNKLVTCSNDKFIKIWSLELEEIMTLKIKDKGGIEDFQLAVRVSGEDIYTVTLNGNINHYKAPLTTKNPLPTDIIEGFSGIPGKILYDFKKGSFYTTDSYGKACKIMSKYSLLR